jgi:hypothetical protein
MQQRVEPLVVLGERDEGGAVPGDGLQERPDVIVLDLMMADDLVGDRVQVVAQGCHPPRVRPLHQLRGGGRELADVHGHGAVDDAVVEQVGYRLVGPADRYGG